MRGRAGRRVAGSILGVALIAALLVTPSSALAERTIALSTGTFEISLAPGGSATDGLLVANNGDEPITALVYTADVEIDEEGNQTYTRPSPTPENYLASPASWIRLKVPDSTKIVANTPYLEMEPGIELPVDFELVVPQNATPGDYNAVVFFEMFEFDEGSEGAVSRVSGRIGARVDLRVVGEIVDDIKLTDLSARTFVIGDTTPFSVRVANEGNIDKKIDVSLTLLGTGESEEWSKVLEEGANVYAQRERLYDGAVSFDGVGFGKYTFRAAMDYDKEQGDGQGTVMPETVTVDRQIWVIPLWLAIVVLIVVGLPLIYLTYRVSTRGLRAKRAEKAEKPSKRGRSRRSRGVDADADADAEAADVTDGNLGGGPAASVAPLDERAVQSGGSADPAVTAVPGEGQDELWAASESLFEDEE